MLLENLRSSSYLVRRGAMFMLAESDRRVKEVVDACLKEGSPELAPIVLLGNKALPPIYQRLSSDSVESEGPQKPDLVRAAVTALVTLESDGVRTVLRDLYRADSSSHKRVAEKTDGDHRRGALRLLRESIAEDGTTRLETDTKPWEASGMRHALKLVVGTKQDRDAALEKTSQMIDAFERIDWTLEAFDEHYYEVLGVVTGLGYAAKTCRDDEEGRRISEQCSRLIELKYGLRTTPYPGMLNLFKWKATQRKQPELLHRGLREHSLHDFPLSVRFLIEMTIKFGPALFSDEDARWITSVLGQEQAGPTARRGALYLLGYGAVGNTQTETQRAIVAVLDSADSELRLHAALALAHRPSRDRRATIDAIKRQLQKESKPDVQEALDRALEVLEWR